MADPLLRTELVRRMRERNAFWVPTAYLLALGMLFASSYSGGRGGQPWRLGQELFAQLSQASFLLIALAVTAFSAGAITIEREQRTLIPLLMTRLRAWDIVRGKLLGAVGYVLLVASVSLPVLTTTLLFGGVTLGGLVLHYLSLTVMAVALASIGLLVSASFKRSMYSIAFSFLLLAAGWLAVARVVDFLRGMQQIFEVPLMRYVAFLSPLYFIDGKTSGQWPLYLITYLALAALCLRLAVLRVAEEAPRGGSRKVR